MDSFVTLGAATFTVSNDFALSPLNTLNFVLGTNSATIAVVGDLVLGGTYNIIAGGGFASGTYTLMTYTGSLGGNLPALGATPAGYTFTIDTNTAGQVSAQAAGVSHQRVSAAGESAACDDVCRSPTRGHPRLQSSRNSCRGQNYNVFNGDSAKSLLTVNVAAPT